jgi:hypothetical protein
VLTKHVVRRAAAPRSSAERLAPSGLPALRPVLTGEETLTV